MPIAWPRELVTARVVTWAPVTPAQAWTAGLGGVPATAFLSGGAFWKLELSDIVLRGRAAILAGRRLQGLLQAGVRPLIIRPCDCRQAPLAAGQSLAGEAEPIVCAMAAAGLRAVSATLAFTGDHRAVVAGDQFSIEHPTWGLRLYRVTAVTAGEADAPHVRFLPPLREAVEEGTAVDFNRPGSWMRLDGPMVVTPRIGNRVMDASAAFCELERPPTESERA